MGRPYSNDLRERVVRAVIKGGFPWDEAPRHLIRDRDRIYGSVVTRRLRAMPELKFSAHTGSVRTVS
jgi:hypothetical protein